MENEEMKKCRFCAELIKAEAIKCRYCGSNLVPEQKKPSSSPIYWQRVNEGKKIAGVCTGLARQFDASILILPLRIFFLMTIFFWGFGLILYIVLWILMPPPTDQPGKGKDTIPSPPPSQPTKEGLDEKSPCPPADQGEPGMARGPMLLFLMIIIVAALAVAVFVSNQIYFTLPFWGHSITGLFDLRLAKLFIIVMLAVVILLLLGSKNGQKSGKAVNSAV